MTPPQSWTARSIQPRFPIFFQKVQCNVKHFYVREPKNGYGSFPGCPLSKRTHFGRSACSSAAGSLAIVQFPHFFAPTHRGVHYGRVHGKKSWVRILCREPGCRLCPFGQRHLKSTFPSNTNFAPFTARPARRGRLAPSPRRARRQGRHPSPRPPPAAVRAARAALRGYPGRARAQLHAPAPPDPRMLAIAPRLAPATPRRRAPPLGPSSRVPPVGLGRAGGGRCKGCTCVAPVPIFS